MKRSGVTSMRAYFMNVSLRSRLRLTSRAEPPGLESAQRLRSSDIGNRGREGATLVRTIEYFERLLSEDRQG